MLWLFSCVRVFSRFHFIGRAGLFTRQRWTRLIGDLGRETSKSISGCPFLPLLPPALKSSNAIKKNDDFFPNLSQLCSNLNLYWLFEKFLPSIISACILSVWVTANEDTTQRRINHKVLTYLVQFFSLSLSVFVESYAHEFKYVRLLHRYTFFQIISNGLCQGISQFLDITENSCLLFYLLKGLEVIKSKSKFCFLVQSTVNQKFSGKVILKLILSFSGNFLNYVLLTDI